VVPVVLGMAKTLKRHVGKHPNVERFDQEGNLTDVLTREHIVGLLQNLVDWGLRIGPK